MTEALGVESDVVEEHGRWAVYLTVTLWREEGDVPFERVRRRIADYATARDAEVARSWMHRGADRDSRPLTGF